MELLWRTFQNPRLVFSQSIFTVNQYNLRDLRVSCLGLGRVEIHKRETSDKGSVPTVLPTPPKSGADSLLKQWDMTSPQHPLRVSRYFKVRNCALIFYRFLAQWSNFPPISKECNQLHNLKQMWHSFYKLLPVNKNPGPLTDWDFSPFFPPHKWVTKSMPAKIF